MTDTFFAISNNELDRLPAVEAGAVVVCKQCGDEHALAAHGPLLTISCGDSAYLAAVGGKLLDGYRVVVGQ